MIPEIREAGFKSLGDVAAWTNFPDAKQVKLQRQQKPILKRIRDVIWQTGMQRSWSVVLSCEGNLGWMKPPPRKYHGKWRVDCVFYPKLDQDKVCLEIVVSASRKPEYFKPRIWSEDEQVA